MHLLTGWTGVVGAALLLLPGAAAGQAKAKNTVAAARNIQGQTEVPVYYYNGRHRVELRAALDEVELEADAPEQAAEKAKAHGAPALVPSAHGRAAVHVRLRTPAAGRAGLKQAARRLAQDSGSRKARAVLYAPDADRTEKNRRVLTSRIAVKVVGGQDPNALAARHGLSVAEKVPFSPDTWILTSDSPDLLDSLEAANSLYETDYVEFATPMIARQRERRAAPTDPLFSSQWHLLNSGAPQQYLAAAGNDVNIKPAWDSGLTGAGVNIAVTDDGLQLDHPDLAPNVRPGLSIDLNNGDSDPTPSATETDSHGTACAGVAAARGNNGIGGAGAAYGAGLAGIRLIAGPSTDEMEAKALLHQMAAARPEDRIHISTNSWGPPDDGQTLDGPGPLTRAALARAAREGRGGLGTIFTWAAGNGRRANDDVNFDGYANDPHTIAVGATYADGTGSDYSEPGAAMFVNAPSSTYLSATHYGIVTTDRTGAAGYTAGDYTPASGSATFGGTSSATPLAAGCIALLLEANPNLTWRDVQHILASTSTRNDPADPGWATNAAGYSFNHRYGFGRINTAAAVAAARTWRSVEPQAEPVIASSGTPLAIPDNLPAGVSQSVSVTAPASFRAEHVQVTVDIDHTWRGDLEIYLTSPSGTTARLAGVRGGDSGRGFRNWTFLSLPTWGENPNGLWTLRVADRAAQDTGTINSWSLKITGTAPDSPVFNDFATTSGGWVTFGTDTAQAWSSYDQTAGALKAHVAAGASNRVIGWRTVDPAELLPCSALDPGSYVRAKFWVYAGGQAGTDPKQIPNFRLRASARFAETSVLDVMHHSTPDPEGSAFAADVCPSTSPSAPSLYRVDFAPINVPQLRAAGSQEGISRAFEAFSQSSEPQENGFVALTESSIGSYPAPPLSDTPDVLLKTYATEADFTDSFYYATAKLDRAKVLGGDLDRSTVAASVNGGAQKQSDGSPLPLLSPAEVRVGASAAGVTLDTSAVGPEFIAIAAADFLRGNAEDTDLSKRVRVEPGKVYQLRFHATSTRQADRNAHVRFRARTLKFLWTQRLEVGGAFGAGVENNAIAAQMLPGAGSRNPDQRTPGEPGGWYTLLVHTPLSPDIRSDFPAGTPLTTSMPALAAQPGPGVNAPSRRDLFPGVDILDTISAGEHWLEQGQMTVDRIEIRQFPLIE